MEAQYIPSVFLFWCHDVYDWNMDAGNLDGFSLLS